MTAHFLFFAMEELSYRRSVYLHSALRTKLLTAEAAYARAPIDFRLFIFYFYCLCGADITADAAADAHFCIELRARG